MGYTKDKDGNWVLSDSYMSSVEKLIADCVAVYEMPEEERLWYEVGLRSNKHKMYEGVKRSKERIKRNSEVFTPTSLVIEMLKSSDAHLIGGKGKTVIDPACGDGQFLEPVKWVKVLFHGMSEEDALKDIFGIDIMRDNVDICKKRLGGGTIVMGDFINPKVRLDGQTMEEHLWMSNEIPN